MNLKRNHKNYIKVSRGIFTKSISLEAKGFMSHLSYLSDDFKFSVAGISKVFGISEHKANKIINELCENGYCIKLLEKDKNNRFKELHYFFFSDKIDEITVEPHGTFSVAEISNAENLSLYYNNNIILDIINTLKEKNKKESQADAPNLDLRTQPEVLDKTTHLISKEKSGVQPPCCAVPPSTPKHLQALESVKSQMIPEVYESLVEWLDYKWLEKKFKYKSEKTILTLYKQLLSQSGGNVSLISQSIQECIGNGYLGVFIKQPKTQPKDNRPSFRESQNESYDFSNYKRK